jgi:hypothetical protein
VNPPLRGGGFRALQHRIHLVQIDVRQHDEAEESPGLRLETVE